MARGATEFQTIRSEGGLLPIDLLRRVLDPKEKLDGTRPEDYGLPADERLNEVITQSWNRLRKHWAEFRASAAKLPQEEAGTGVTNDKWNLPLLRELGFGLLPTSAGPVIGGRTYAINRFFGAVPVHLVGCSVSLDHRAAGVRGAAAANPHGLVQELVNRTTAHIWAIVSNGLRFRVLRNNQALSRQSFLEFDLEAMFTGEVYSDFVLLWLVAHATRFAPSAEHADTCWLELWTKLANELGTRALGDLRGGVERALQTLGEGFTSHPKNTALRDALRTGLLPLADFHGQLLRVIYRLIFLFVAEDRTLDGQSLLHPRSDAEGARLARERYAAHYSTDRLRELASNIKGSRHADLWRQFQLLVDALSGNAESAVARERLALPTLGSFLWDPDSTAALNTAELTNHDFLETLRHLAFTRQGRVLRPVDYKNLGAEELGGVYESLLALTPQISTDGARFTFAEFAGNERKTSGSYYTHDSLVQSLLDSALDPVVAEAIKGKTGAEAERAILSLKVCDPAVGSGHFLVGAAHRLARHLARVRALAQGDSEPSPLLYQHALRDAIGHCLYGVDVNPMAAELCRVSLWLEALEPGKPLSFLDHHIRVGNSLVGATPELIVGGLPDDAFAAIEGDDKKACAVLKKRNKGERAGRGPLFAEQDAETQVFLQQAAAELEALPDDRPEEIRAKELAFRRHEDTDEYRHKKHMADSWAAAFVIRKHFHEPGRESSASGITQGHLNDLAQGKPLPAELATEVERLSGQYQFFHWHLTFPEVFGRGGFDAVLGNPPWERLRMEETVFFAGSSDHIAKANTSKRGQLIAALKISDPSLAKAWDDYKRQTEGFSALVRSTGLYPDTGRGKFNLAGVFVERACSLIRTSGRLGILVPTAVATDEAASLLFNRLVSNNRLLSLYDFENSKGLFPDVDSRYRFCLLTVVAAPRNESTFDALFGQTVIEAVAEQESHLLISANDIIAINPNSRTCPVVNEQRDFILLSAFHRRHPVLIRHEPAQNLWGAKPTFMFQMSDEKGDFLELDAIQRGPQMYAASRDGVSLVRLFEAKLIHQFDHRYATFEDQSKGDREAGNARELRATERSPGISTIARFWIPETLFRQRIATRPFQGDWLLSYREIARATDVRTIIAAIIPFTAAGRKLPQLYLKVDARTTSCMAGALNSFCLDFIARCKLSGTSIGNFFFEQLPLPSPSLYESACPWSRPPDTVREWLLSRVLELTYTASDLESFARDCGWTGPPFRWDEERRFLLRCELDAAFFHLYLPAEASGDWRCAEIETAEDLRRLKANFPTPRDAVSYVMDKFPIVKRKDEERFNGDYRTKRVILEIYDALAKSIRTGQPYRTRLDPPPADPRVAHASIEQPVSLPSLRATVALLSQFPAVAWATPALVAPDHLALFTLIDVIRALGGSAQPSHVREAAILVRNPAMALAFLDQPQAREWVRVIGAEAQPLPANVVSITQFQKNASDLAWSRAISQLTGSGALQAKADRWTAALNFPASSGQDWVAGRAAIAAELVSTVLAADLETRLTAFLRSVEDGTARRAVS